MHFAKSLQGSKSVITMRPLSIESTLLLFLLYIELPCRYISKVIKTCNKWYKNLFRFRVQTLARYLDLKGCLTSLAFNIPISGLL